MLNNRPIVASTLGYILGIIVGLYCKISMVLFFVLFLVIYKIAKKPNKKEFKLISIKRYFRYIKLIINKKALLIIMISALISNSIVLYKNREYEVILNKYDNKQIQLQGEIVSNAENKEYKKRFEFIVKNGDDTLKNKKLYLETKEDLQYGDFLKIDAIYLKPIKNTNYGGFNYSNYLKTKKIYGTINARNIQKIGRIYSFKGISNKIFLEFKNTFESNFEENVSSFLSGIILGDTSEIDDTIKQNFSDSNASHILAISGMHIGYLTIFCMGLKKIIGIRNAYILSIIILGMYITLIGFHASAIRAVIMSILVIVAKLIHKKSDIWTSISLSILLILFFNPYLIMNSGLILSYFATLGIIIYSKLFTHKKIIRMLLLPLSVLIATLPIIAKTFNQIPIFSLFISIIICFIIAPLIFFSFLFLLTKSPLLKDILRIGVKLVLKLADIGSKIPLNKILIVTPSLCQIFLYYIIVFLVLALYLIYRVNKKTAFIIRIRNLISLFKYKNRRKIFPIFLISIFIFSIIKIIPQNLKIYFIDVGQGDSSLIVTPRNTTILIDGGGSESYDVGTNVLIPYLLDRGIKKVDYLLPSHFDQDHIRSDF